MQHVLSVFIWFPMAIGVFVLCVANDERPNVARGLGLLGVLVSLVGCVPLVRIFDISKAGMQCVEQHVWLPSLGLTYHLGIDGLSLLLIVLSIFTNLIVLLATWESITRRVAQYIAALLIMQGLLVGVFSSRDVILFYIFWEATLIPMYLMIGIWGSDNRVYAAIKFFLYTFLGSVLSCSKNLSMSGLKKIEPLLKMFR